MSAKWEILTSSAKLKFLNVLVVVVGTYLIGRILYRLYFHPLANIPGPRLAAVSKLWLYRSFYSGRHVYTLQQAHEKYGTCIRIAPNELSFSTTTAQSAIYSSPAFLKTGTLSEGVLVRELCPANVFTTPDSAQHIRQRKMMESAFTPKALADQEQHFLKHSRRLIERLDEISSHKPPGALKTRCLDLGEWMGFMAWDLVGDLAYGEPFGTLDSDDERARRTITKIMHSFPVAAGVAQALEALPFKNVLKYFIGMLAAPLHTFRSMTSTKLSRRVQRYNRSCQDGVQGESFNEDRRDFIASILSEAQVRKTQLDTTELLSNAFVLIVAGAETSTKGFVALFRLLLSPKHSDILRHVQHELRTAFPGGLSEVVPSRLSPQQLPWLNGCIHEALRLYPPFPGGAERKTPKNGKQLDGIWVPGGTVVSADMFTIMRSSRYFKTPEKFAPERWIESEATQAKNKNINQGDDKLQAWRPFSLGKRACLGRNMAMLVLRLTAAMLLYEYNFELVDCNFDWDRDAKWMYIWYGVNLPVRLTKHQQTSNLI